MPANHLFKDPVDAISKAAEEIGGAKWSIATTYEFNENHIDDLVRSEDLNLGQLLILSDKTGARHKVSQNKSFRTVFADPSNGIHGKIVLSRGTTGVALSVSSANLTAPGFGGDNLEIFSLIAQPSQHLVLGAVRWLKNRFAKLPWHVDPTWIKRLSQLEAGLHNRPGQDEPRWLDNDNESIADGIKRLLKGKPVKSLTVFSPYLSSVAVDGLVDKFSLSRSQIKIVVPAMEHKSKRILQGMKKWKDRLYIAKGKLVSQFPHSKVLAFECFNGGGLLVTGSANATEPGLFKKAGSLSRHRAECMIALPVSKKGFREFYYSVPTQKLPSDDTLTWDKPEDGEVEIETEGLIAWYMPASGTVEIWAQSSAELPAMLPFLEINKKRFNLNSYSTKKGPGLYQLPENQRGKVEAALRNEARVTVVWGGLKGQLTLLETIDPEPEGAESLWGGNPNLGTGVHQKPRPGGKPGDGVSQEGGVYAELDEYERRSLSVCKAIGEDLKNPYPSHMGLLEELWREKMHLDCLSDVIPEKVRTGCYLFLATRLLAVQSNSDKIGENEPNIFRQIRKGFSAWRGDIFKKDSRIIKQLGRWAQSGMWIEGQTEYVPRIKEKVMKRRHS
ncbi:MAG: hypothetical protein A2117_01360 [Candidatus Wildermuthbacteria bacterium GWA2_46_15]|uniref:Uncharacterized protein n=1 Tax=Candidatus Wildermuthbacteria bacterium GWA2_46_15 TaxID=1802443 RepID=A0A1G2QQ39_9BACT|nr:MAG: hypothetical protein A2117_01360 [Candidatus Wildermuthbacteria bacterium GWA2_46_15]